MLARDENRVNLICSQISVLNSSIYPKKTLTINKVLEHFQMAVTWQILSLLNAVNLINIHLLDDGQLGFPGIGTVKSYSAGMPAMTFWVL